MTNAALAPQVPPPLQNQILPLFSNIPRAIDTDSIAGYWSGEVVGKPAAGKDVPPRDVQVIIIPGCTVGKVCGKFSEDNQCPGDIVLTMVAGNRYRFLSETVSGARHIYGSGDIRRFDLELRSDGTIQFMYHNGATLTGVLQRH